MTTRTMGRSIPPAARRVLALVALGVGTAGLLWLIYAWRLLSALGRRCAAPDTTDRI